MYRACFRTHIASVTCTSTIHHPRGFFKSIPYNHPKYTSIISKHIHIHSRFSSASSDTMSSITSIIRFVDEHGRVVLGDPVASDDIKSTTVITGDPLYPSTLQRTSEQRQIVSYLPPIDPRLIQCIGLNYRDHATESAMKEPNFPVLFYKNLSAAAAHLQPVVIPKVCQSKPETDYEAELGVIIGLPALNVSEADALSYVLGYVTANDVSARDQQLNAEKSGSQWNRGKGFDTFAPFGPALVYASAIPDPQKLDISFKLNGETKQHSNTSSMIFSVAKIISYLSQSSTLLPGTLILTGTPHGVGFARKPPLFLNEGDVCEVTIEKIGTLKNTITMEK